LDRAFGSALFSLLCYPAVSVVMAQPGTLLRRRSSQHGCIATSRRRTSCGLEAGCPDEDARTQERPHRTRPRLLDRSSLSSTLRWYEPPRRMYTRRELLADRIINFGGAGLSWIGAPLLAYMSWAAGDSLAKQAGFWAFGAGLVTMLTCSAFYHLLAWRWDLGQQLLSLDHIGISSMIMGAYVPIMQMVGAWKTLAVVLALGTLGWLIEAYKLCSARQNLNAKSGFNFLDTMHVVRYLVMGWACLAVAQPLWSQLPGQALAFYGAGGLTYTFGVPIWIQYGMEFHMPFWHFAVVAASACFYIGHLQLMGLPLP